MFSSNILLSYEINEGSRCSSLTANKLWSKSTNGNTCSITIFRWGSESDALLFEYSGSNTRRTRMSQMASSTIRTKYLTNSRTPWYRLAVYLRRYRSITPVAIVFAFGHLFVYNDCVKIFRLTLMRLIACYLFVVRCWRMLSHLSGYCYLRPGRRQVLALGCSFLVLTDLPYL